MLKMHLNLVDLRLQGVQGLLKINQTNYKSDARYNFQQIVDMVATV